VRTVEQVEKDIGAINETITKLQSERDKTLAKLAKVKEQRSQSAFAALGNCNSAAKARLQKAHNEQRMLEMAVEDLESALSGATDKLASLQAERDESIKSESWQKFLELGEAAVAEAKGIDELVGSLGDALAKHEATLGALTDLSNKGGRPKIFKLAHCRRSMEHKLNSALPGEFTKHKEFSSGYGEFMRARIDGAVDGAEGEQRTA
jgi:hypothetical protein